MLSIKPIGGSCKEVNYYSALGDAEQHDYYAEDGNRPGVWFGSGAAALGLSGAVNPPAFKNLLDGLSADGSEQLVRTRKKGQVSRRAGFDLTFSVPKSFSVAWSIADRKTRTEMDRCARSALYQTLQMVENLCGQTRRGKDGVRVEDGKLTFAIFSHDTARGIQGQAPDPNRHFHAVLVNAVVRNDGSTGALDARPLFLRRMKMAIGALFRAELSSRLEELGFATERPTREPLGDKASWFELACVPKPLLSEMSKRRAAIETWLARQGLSGARASERAALRTRESKKNFSQREFFESWRATAHTHGFDQSQISAAIQDTIERRCPSVRSIIESAVNEIVEKQARFTELELLERVAVESQCCGIGISEIRNGLSTFLSTSEELVRLSDDRSGVKTFTTRSMLALENRMLAKAGKLGYSDSHAIAPERANAVLNRFATLRDEQVEAVRHLVSGTDIACINGVAGSGKTFMLRAANECWQSARYRTVGTSLSAKASRGLEEGSGIRSMHIHRLLKEIETGEQSVDSKTILVVDEAGMVGTKQAERLISIVSNARAKIVLVGDYRQLQAIDAGAAFRGIMDRVGQVSMNEIIRQRESWSRRMVKDLRDGHAEQALKEMWERGKLFIGTDRDDAMERLVADWKQRVIDQHSLHQTIALAGTNLEVRALNRRMQAVRILEGQIGGPSIEVDGLEFHEGDRVLVTRNHHPLCLRNGTIADVVEIHGKTLRLRLQNGVTVAVDTSAFDKITLGYAISTHRAQGMTTENAFVLGGNLTMTDRELSYVQGSRAKSFTKFYSDVLSTGEGIGGLADLMNRSRQKELAIDHVMDGVV
ncbi:relaxase domain-containing protein [Stieleria sp. ICT_E10.1]|uniref:MobF family relaxase n=1 Tax=Stieleria sedimenti TaxID=2976331 RepID=UPI00217F3AB8|nr:MobF family relaxase [Stieleria sedimenti]MCS7466295.1 relaxase domain-containing protein [Stieleria sedimenti]